jgi:hypothetical protein
VASFFAMPFNFMRSNNTVGKICVPKTTWTTLKKLQSIFMPSPTAQEWTEIARRFND